MTRGVENFQPARLQQALATRALTQGQLASLIGISPSTISKWMKEGAKHSPEATTLERLATTLNLSVEWFTRPLFSGVSKPLFRSNAQALKTARAKLRGRAEWLREMAQLFNQFADYPDVKLPDFQFKEPEAISDADIETAAEACRTMWQLGQIPIQDLMLAAEGAGIIVAREETEISAIEGLSCWVDDASGRRPFVLLSADKANAFRSRFDLAHEIGHLVLHRHVPEGPTPERHNLMEKQAHRFAGALLLPSETFAADVRIPVSLDSLLVLKQKWGVSVAAMVMRLSALDLIDDTDKLNLFKRLSSRWGRKAEPGDDKREPESPRLLRRTIELLVGAGVMPTEGIPRFIGLSERDIEQLAGLREGYFSTAPEVVELATLRVARGDSRSLDQGQQAAGNLANVVQFRKAKR